MSLLHCFCTHSLLKTTLTYNNNACDDSLSASKLHLKCLTPGEWGGELPLWESVGSRYAPHPHPPPHPTPFSTSGRSFCPHPLPLIIWPCLQFYSDLVGLYLESPPFSACRQSFCPPKLTKSLISLRSCWVPFWTSSGAPLLILTREHPTCNAKVRESYPPSRQAIWSQCSFVESAYGVPWMWAPFYRLK